MLAFFSHLFQVGACALFLTCGTLIGYFHRRMTDASHDKTFAGTRFFIESRIKLEYEKEQQEQLLLSVIPAYIAAEVKRGIMLKMANACQNANSHSKQRFHELYVQRHNNVRAPFSEFEMNFHVIPKPSSPLINVAAIESFSIPRNCQYFLACAFNCMSWSYKGPGLLRSSPGKLPSAAICTSSLCHCCPLLMMLIRGFFFSLMDPKIAAQNKKRNI
ncbi:adenylate cyclase type 2 [Caerostris extrusa]|uniref:Adenylate cyclase type 2 n=1 Tax=Caerostris extrusa TaxID=172846 RepID=A0AAV4T370_CAEEX|nr:adenylate cyclase type 2 [Caerostris extrusa]